MQDIQSLLKKKLEQHKERQKKTDPIKDLLKEKYGDSVTLHSKKKGTLVLTCNSAPVASNVRLEMYQLQNELGVEQIRLRIDN